MKKTEERKNIKNIFLALLVMLLWGSLFPCVKLGYAKFGIDTGSASEILMFAGMRFFICGILISAYEFFTGNRLSAPIRKSLAPIFVMGFFAITLHYAFTYIGLTMTDSSKTAILKQLGVLFYICFSFLFISEEQFGIGKLLGAILGFFGIIAINAGSSGISFSFGDALIILASICTVVSNIVSKKAMERNSSAIVTGLSQLLGGAMLICMALCMGASPIVPTAGSLPLAIYICTATIAGYCLWFYIVKTGTLSNLFIIKFAEPMFAAIFGALLLGENIFKIQYLAAFILISAGIVFGNISRAK